MRNRQHAAGIRKAIPMAVAVALIVGGSAAQAQNDAVAETRAPSPQPDSASNRSAPLKLNIAAQPISDALNEFARQSGLQVFFVPAANGKELTSNPVVGTYAPAEALVILLANTGLHYEYLDERSVAIVDPAARAANDRPRTSRDTESTAGAKQRETSWFTFGKNRGPMRLAQAAADSQSTAGQQAAGGASTFGRTTADAVIEEITITGTHIRGARPSAPVVTISQEEMRLSGQNNLGEVIRALPQNFSGGQNPGVVLGAQNGIGNNFNSNFTGGSALNLRGLGADATLTLLNGTRLPYDGASQAVDISVIPAAAVERVEVLLDGASAIYGSDAVAGVANVILKRDYQGFEFSARYGAATEGGYAQQQYTAVGGTTWETGGVLLAGDYSHNEDVSAGDRHYLDNAVSPDATVYPRLTQKGALLSGHQALGESAEFSLDAYYMERSQSDLLAVPGSFFPAFRLMSNWGIAPALRVGLPGSWSLRLGGVTGRNEAEIDQRTIAAATGAELSRSVRCLCNRLEAMDLRLEGPLFDLPAGEARISLGGGYRRNEFANRVMIGAGTSIGGADHSYHFHAEVDAPLVAEAQDIRLVERLSLNAAVRHENYKSFGETTTPKVGVIWSVVPGFDLKASWGRSFKVPTLNQQFATRPVVHYPYTFFEGAPEGMTAIAIFGGNPDLGPERAKILTAGFLAQPRALPGFSLEFSWFDVDYTDRVIQPVNPLSQALSNPIFAEFVTLAPTVEQQNAIFAAAGLPPGTFTNNQAPTIPYDPARRTSSPSFAARKRTRARSGRAAAMWLRVTRGKCSAAK